MALLATGLALGGTTLRAQSAPPTTNTPATETVGPRELQNFSIEGNRTQPAQQPAQESAQAPAAQPAAPAETAVRPTSRAPARTSETATRQPDARSAPEPIQQTRPSSSVTVALPGLDSGANAVSAVAPAPAVLTPPQGTLAPDKSFALIPWLLAALAVVAGAAFLLFRRRHGRQAFAGGPALDSFETPEPAPAPALEPVPAPPAPEPAPVPGVVSVRLRPWLDIDFQPLRCIVEDEQVTFEFEVELFNSGSAPARAILLEANLFNAGASQDQEIGSFFANPARDGERMAAIAPLQRSSVRTQLAAPLAKVQILEAGGRTFFVPLIAFNANYRWAGGDGQTSAAYLLGREGQGEKMAPFRLDLGPRVFRGIGARALPVSVRS